MRYVLTAVHAMIAQVLKKVFAILAICVKNVRICAYADIVLIAQSFVLNVANVVVNVTIIIAMNAVVATSAQAMKVVSAILVICAKLAR